MTSVSAPRIKICGITNKEDALHASGCGADALGFVFYSGSPRFIQPDAVKEIIAELPPFLKTVGLFVNEDSRKIREVVEFCGLDTVQLHGEESPEECFFPPKQVIKALRLKNDLDEKIFSSYQVSAFLLDAYLPGKYGGTGTCCDWSKAQAFAAQYRIILAGGLSPDNVFDAVKQVQPYGIDVSSGVEKSPGKKDPGKVAMFIRMARKAFN